MSSVPVKIAVVGLAALMLVLTAVTAVLAAGPTVVRLSGNGGSGDEGSWGPTITGDGRFVVFLSYSPVLVAGDTNGTRDTFLYDRQTGSVERISVSATGAEGDDESFAGYASLDGRYVAFGSEAANFGMGGTSGYSQVYVKDRQDGALELITATPGGAPAMGHSDPEDISDDGRYVVFYSWAPDLVPGDTNDSPEVFLRDRVSGTTTRVAVSTAGTPGDKSSGGSSMTPDARYIAFSSESTNLVAGDTNGLADIFLRDLQQGTTERLNLSSAEAQATGGGAFLPRLSDDGRYVVFESRAVDLVPDDTNAKADIFLRDRVLGTTARVSLSDAGGQAEGESYNADVSADGRFVVFTSTAANLVPGDTNAAPDIFLRDIQAGTTTRLSVSSEGAQGDLESFDPRMSNDGRYVVFSSLAANLVAGDTNGTWDVFLADRGSSGAGVTFSDIDSSPYKAAIENLAAAGIVSGYDMGDHWEFRPLNTLKRAQFAKMIVGSWGYPVFEETPFAPFTDLGPDVLDDPYPHEFVGVAYSKGITNGKTATTFAPYTNITRAQLVTMVVRSIQNDDPRTLQQPPIGWTGTLPGSDPTHGANIRLAEYNGLLEGIGLSQWDVWADAVRGETAQILYNMRGL